MRIAQKEAVAKEFLDKVTRPGFDERRVIWLAGYLSAMADRDLLGMEEVTEQCSQ